MSHISFLIFIEYSKSNRSELIAYKRNSIEAALDKVSDVNRQETLTMYGYSYSIDKVH